MLEERTGRNEGSHDALGIHHSQGPKKYGLMVMRHISMAKSIDSARIRSIDKVISMQKPFMMKAVNEWDIRKRISYRLHRKR